MDNKFATSLPDQHGNPKQISNYQAVAWQMHLTTAGR
jgi:hypothetical protein